MPSRIKRNLLHERNLPHARLEADDARVSARLCALVVATALVSAACGAPARRGSDGPREAAHAAPRAESAADADDAALPAHADDVADYTLRATLDPAAHTVHGEGTIHWRNTSTRPVRELWLHLYLNAFKNERSAFLRERVGRPGQRALPTTGARSTSASLTSLDAGDAAPVDLWPAAELAPRPATTTRPTRASRCPREVAPGEAIAARRRLRRQAARSSSSAPATAGRFHMVGQWFPKLARLEPDGTWAHFPFHHLAEFYADFGTYDVTLDVPAGASSIGATGPRVERRVEDGRRIERHVQADMHDFAWTAWDAWQTRRRDASTAST